MSLDLKFIIIILHDINVCRIQAMCPVTQKFKKISQRKNQIFDSFKRDRTMDEIAQFFLRATDNDLLKLFEKISAMNPDQVKIRKKFDIIDY